MTIGIKPCPFCGGEAQLLVDTVGNYSVQCTVCGIGTKRKKTAGEALKQWKRRVSIPTGPDEQED